MPLHPVVQGIMDRVRAAGFNGYAGFTVEAARAHYANTAKAFGPGPDLREVRDISIPVEGGAIAARLYLPVEKPSGLCVYFHGGGWTLGALDDFDALMRTLAERSGAAMLSVDYRLAPEFPFPIPVNDAIAAVRYAAANRVALGSDGKLAVGGDSAGGNLATVAALALRGEIEIALQLLFYPAVDTDSTRPGFAAYGTDYMLKSTDIAWFFGHYAPGVDPAEPRLAPLRTPHLTGAPPAWIGVAEYDVLTEEGVEYASKLQAAGVPATLRRYEGVMHGFARQFAIVDVSNRAIGEAATALKAALAG
jgi:acetyl esterase